MMVSRVQALVKIATLCRCHYIIYISSNQTHNVASHFFNSLQNLSNTELPIVLIESDNGLADAPIYFGRACLTSFSGERLATFIVQDKRFRPVRILLGGNFTDEQYLLESMPYTPVDWFTPPIIILTPISTGIRIGI